jgi:hypothetical protein
LPETIYLNQFQDSSYQLVSTYEEDMNAATTTMPGGVQSGQNLTVWREQAVKLIASMEFGPIDDSAVYLGWDAGVSGSAASYTIRLPVEADPVFDLASLDTIRFIFDRTSAGVVVLDDLGFRN